jgi:peptidyl-prolyl cis-trans isomerase B (cyclophilin B)
MKQLVGLILGLIVSFTSATGFSESGSPDEKNTGSITVIMETGKGTITLELDGEKAPESVANFIAYANAGFYEGTLFHRVISNFMIQGGGFTEDMQRKETRPPIKNEADNKLKNLKGTVAMARTSNPHSATSQFFFNVKDNAFLDHKAPSGAQWGYTVFGRVVDGMDVITAIENVKTTSRSGMQDVPVEPVMIKKVTVK